MLITEKKLMCHIMNNINYLSLKNSTSEFEAYHYSEHRPISLKSIRNIKEVVEELNNVDYIKFADASGTDIYFLEKAIDCISFTIKLK